MDPPIPDFSTLAFRFIPTRCFFTATYDAATGVFSRPERRTDPTLSVHLASTALHYGQACFEGLKAFAQADGKVRIFRPRLNAERIIQSAARVAMPAPSVELFLEMVTLAVQQNMDYIPPYGSGGALYIRPFLYGESGTLVLEPAERVVFCVFVTPVGDYYRAGIKAVHALVVDDFNRAAPLGNGDVKLAGNYAPSLPSSTKARKLGYPITLFLDPIENKYVDEFATSNFVGIKHDGTLCTPKSRSILKSVTRISLFELAASWGWKTEEGQIEWKHVQQGMFTEVVACGTAVVVTPIGKICTQDGEEVVFGDGTTMGERTSKLFYTVRGIQNGTEEDVLGWMYPKEGISAM
jgi:branched-chain amino acid aminotransferase